MARTRRELLAGTAAILLAPGCATASRRGAGAAANGDWPAYGGTNAAAKYSPLDQINRDNAGRLKIAWEWTSPDAEILKANPQLNPGEFQATPLMIDGVLYVSTAMCQVAAIDAATGRTLWLHDPGSWKRGPFTSKGFQHRGVAYWADGEDRRILIATGDNRLIALEAGSGRRVAGFGVNGEVDIGSVGLQRPLPDEPVNLFGVTSPPTICRDVVVVGQYIHDRPIKSLMPPGDVRGFDVRTGALKWTFHTIPMKGEPGYETWLEGSAERTGNANIWAPMSADDALGLVYLPGSCPTNNLYGGDRPGDNLYGNSLIALDAETGKLRWHFQTVHHDIWDYDLPCAPNLVDIRVGSRTIRAVAQVTKQGFTFVFDRETGEPVWPIEERPVPQSPLKGERTAATQPFPTRPPPFEPQGVSKDMLIDLTPEIRAEAETILEGYSHGPLFMPYGKRPTILRPAWLGGANWGGAGVDPETGVLYVPSVSNVASMALDDDGQAISGEAETEEIAGRSRIVMGPRGLPLFKPPYGRITAIDLNRGEILWMKANGPGASEAPAIKRFNLGWIGSMGRTGPLVTRTLLFLGEGPHDRRFSKKVLRAWDKATGEVIAEIPLPGGTLGPPMSGMAGGRQYIICGMGLRDEPHRLVALALPEEETP